MTAYDPDLTRQPNGLMRWLGFGSGNASQNAEVDEAKVDDAALPNTGLDDRRERRRRELLNDISSFLVTHRLEVSGYTLAIAFDIITGANPKLARLIEQRVAKRQPVSLDWLEKSARNCGRGDGSALLDELMGKLESSIEEFSQTTSNARSATTEYNSALQHQVGELERVSKAGVVISELASIAKVMLDRTRDIELEMTRSEMKTKALQDRLEEARREAEMDHLTGLPNRRAFESLLTDELDTAVINSEPLCVAFCDIDHFKRINDTHGHEAGDRVLRTVATTLAKISDDRCHVARHGGEEFVVLFRDKTVDEASAILDKTREAMAARKLVNRATDIPFGTITFSAGIADVFAYPAPRDALKAADDALYAAKHSGRNQVLKASDLDPVQAEAE